MYAKIDILKQFEKLDCQLLFKKWCNEVIGKRALMTVLCRKFFGILQLVARRDEILIKKSLLLQKMQKTRDTRCKILNEVFDGLGLIAATVYFG